MHFLALSTLEAMIDNAVVFRTDTDTDTDTSRLVD
jgi:hypothetical protein